MFETVPGVTGISGVGITLAEYVIFQHRLNY